MVIDDQTTTIFMYKSLSTTMMQCVDVGIEYY
jgi:hypothetical protein